jgi:DNA polymerase III epsilon subunit family exonuclease
MARNIGYAVIDLETTGLDKDGSDAIVEVAIVLLDVKGFVTGYYETIVKPNRKLGATNIHKINEAMIVNAPSFSDVVETVASLLKGRKLIAHNAAFEANFLRKEMLPHDVFINEVNFIDTLKLSRKVLKLRSYKLVSLTEYFQIPFFNAHTALSDTIALSEVFKNLKKYNKREMRRYARAAKPFKYNGVISFDTDNWLPRNPDAFIQTYKPYQPFNLFKMLSQFRKPIPALRGLMYFLGSLITSWVVFAGMDSAKSSALIMTLPLFWFGLYLEHRFNQRSGKRRNRSNKHQHGLSTVEESGGSVTFTVDDMVDFADIENAEGHVYVEPDGNLDAAEQDEFEDFIRNAEIPVDVSGDMVFSLDGHENFDAWADDTLVEKEISKVNSYQEELTVDKVAAKPISLIAEHVVEPQLKELLKPLSLTEVDYKSMWRSYGKNWDERDSLILDSTSGVYTISDDEVQYLFKLVEYFVDVENLQCGKLFDVAKISDGKLSRVKRNDLRGVFDPEDEFSYADSSSYVLVYDYGLLVVLMDSTVHWFAYGDMGVAFGYKDLDSYNKVVIVKEDSSDGVQVEGKMVPMLIKLVKKVKVKFKNVV